MKTCVYCGEDKPDDDFSDEHIWPDALGGDLLPRDVWRTDDVCQRCNSLSGVFIDGAFIRSWMGQAELSSGSLEYLAGRPKRPILAIPLDYLGQIQDVPVPQGHVADYWAGPCGANIVHIRPDDGDEQWSTYAGGDPRAKKSKAGRAYMALTSKQEFWILVSLESFRWHFDRAKRFIVNLDIPSGWPFEAPDTNDATQAEDMKTVDAVIKAGRNGDRIRLRPVISADLGNRMLAKLGLAVGYKLLGSAFLATDYAKQLRWGMREAKPEKRRLIPVRGSGFLSGTGLNGAERVFQWPGGWVLLLNVVEGNLVLSVVAPSGRSMTISICEDQTLLAKLDPKYLEGIVWITVLAAGKAVGPISLADYLGHQTSSARLPELEALSSQRGDPKALPSCDGDDGMT